MATDTSGAVSTEPTGGVTTDASGAVSTGTGDGKSASDTIRELKRRAQDAENRAAAYEQAEKERLEKEALARGEHESVISSLRTELETYKAEAEQFRAAQAARREALLTGLSEDDRPLADGLPLDKLEGLVARLNKQPAAPAPTPARLPGQAPAQAGNLSPEQIKRGVREGGLSWFREHAGGFSQ